MNGQVKEKGYLSESRQILSGNCRQDKKWLVSDCQKNRKSVSDQKFSAAVSQ